MTGTQAVSFGVLSSKDDRYKWIQRTLTRFDYDTLKRRDKGLIMAYLIKISGYSRQHLTRLIAQYRNGGKLLRRQRTTHVFSRRYTNGDIQLIAYLDELHDQPNWFALKKLCERRKPKPQGLPGYIRINSVHQGDLDKRKGVYHINAMDDVTQMEIIVTVERISENYRLPALEEMLSLFPFMIKEFHSDNGSEYINNRVAEMLENSKLSLLNPDHGTAMIML